MTYQIALFLNALALRMNRRAASLQKRLATRLRATSEALLIKANKAEERAAEAQAVANRITRINL